MHICVQQAINDFLGCWGINRLGHLIATDAVSSTTLSEARQVSLNCALQRGNLLYVKGLTEGIKTQREAFRKSEEN